MNGGPWFDSGWPSITIFFLIHFLLHMIYFCSFPAAEARFIDENALGMHSNVVSNAHSLYSLMNK